MPACVPFFFGGAIMALIKFGGGITEMRGSIAGNVFSKNRYGNYVRSRTVPVNPNTARQQLVRAALSTYTTRWAQTLTAGQRTAWNLYGSSVVMTNKLGESINLSGYNHYIRTNSILALGGVAAIDDGPTVFELPEADPTFAVAISEATQLITVTFDDTADWDDETTGHMFIFQGQPQNAQRNFFGGPWRYVGQIPGEAGVPLASPQTKACSFAATEGQRNWVYARIMRADGRLSAPFRADCTVGA